MIFTTKLTYRAWIGWQEWKKNGEVAGDKTRITH
ncbi:hypothetical protein KOY48_05570 [Candidatus Minimicrobia naudis]|uniref:Uncharacterized protein n=1 Tax=Candidatus Minimicrobia naudis TaxID=2841263 RepID=A0A8F1MCD0_9BACT|nr:hypothetical protein KOY48_05570 [Candidatus Minimicrobia naudis]